jgi:anti-anti-sigma factor
MLELIGEHTFERAAELQAALSSMLGQSCLIGVDLTATTLLDSMALAALLTAAERAALRGGEMVVVLPEQAPGVVRRALRMAGIDGAVLIFPSSGAALAYLSRLGGAKRG